MRAAEPRLTALFLLGAAALAWAVTADRMQGMDAGPGTELGSFGWFAGVWAVMMAAMMLPSLIPMAGAYAGRARSGSADVTPQSLLLTTLFTAGYLLAWVLVGLVARTRHRRCAQWIRCRCTDDGPLTRSISSAGVRSFSAGETRPSTSTAKGLARNEEAQSW